MSCRVWVLLAALSATPAVAGDDVQPRATRLRECMVYHVAQFAPQPEPATVIADVILPFCMPEIRLLAGAMVQGIYAPSQAKGAKFTTAELTRALTEQVQEIRELTKKTLIREVVITRAFAK